MRYRQVAPAAVLLILSQFAAQAAPSLLPPKRCEPGADLYRWRDGQGTLHFSDCPPEGIDDVETIPRSSLKPTVIQPPPKGAQTSKARPGRPMKSQRKPRSTGTLSSEQLRALSAKCRWLVGRIRHLKGLVDANRRHSRRPSIWQPELAKWRRELKKEQCDVRI